VTFLDGADESAPGLLDTATDLPLKPLFFASEPMRRVTTGPDAMFVLPIALGASVRYHRGDAIIPVSVLFTVSARSMLEESQSSGQGPVSVAYNPRYNYEEHASRMTVL
jgi:hypothetical protein